MLKSPKSRGYVLLEALIGLMVLTVIVSLISFMMGQLYHRQQLKGCFLDAAATQLMDLQASASYPATVEKLSKEEQKKMKKVTFEKVNTTASPKIVTVSCGEHEEVFEINAITEKKVRIHPR